MDVVALRQRVGMVPEAEPLPDEHIREHSLRPPHPRCEE
jgi:hypothetical protein